MQSLVDIERDIIMYHNSGLNVFETSRKRDRHHSRTGGYTLVELLAVIAIIVILLGIGIILFITVVDKEAKKKSQIIVRLLADAVEHYKRDTGAAPVDIAAATLGTNSKARKIVMAIPSIYVDGSFWRDGYNKVIEYEPAGGLGGTPVVISMGPDGLLSTADDIRSDNTE